MSQDLNQAPLDLAKWIQILDGNGNIQWAWFAHPATYTLDGMSGIKSVEVDTPSKTSVLTRKFMEDS